MADVIIREEPPTGHRCVVQRAHDRDLLLLRDAHSGRLFIATESSAGHVPCRANPRGSGGMEQGWGDIGLCGRVV